MKINYKDFMNSLCDLKAVGVASVLNTMFLRLFLLNLRFLGLKNKNGLYFFREDLISLPQSTVFLKKSGLSRAQLHFTQLNSAYTSNLISVDYRSFRLLSGGAMLTLSNYKPRRKLLSQKRGINVIWNDGTILKHLLIWEQLYAPGFLTLQGFSNWHVFFLRERQWFLSSSWAQKEVNYLLMVLLISKGFSKLFSHYMPPYVLKELYFFLQKKVKNDLSKNHHFFPFYAWILDNLRWSSVLGQSYTTPLKVSLEEENKLKFKHYSLVDDDLIIFGGWLSLHKFELIDDMKTWVFPEEEEFKLEEVFKQLGEDIEKIQYDGLQIELMEDDDYLEDNDIFVWPWVDYWDEFYTMRILKNKKFFIDLTDRNDTDLLLSFYFSLQRLKQKNLLPITPSTEMLLDYFEQTFKSSIWNQLENWYNFFYPKDVNTFQIIGFNREPLLIFLSSLISKLNGLFLYGLQGYDRRNIFFRLFYFLVLKHRGFFFKWFSILLKRVSYKLPWDEELVYISHLLEQDQIFFQDICKKKLYNYYYFEEFCVKCKSNYPFLFFFENFFKSQWGLFVRKKRDELYPGFVKTLEQLMLKDSNAFVWYALKVTIHVYCSILLDFLKHPLMFKKILQYYEAKYDSKLPLVFQTSLKDYGKESKGGSYFLFFKQRKKFEMMLKQHAIKNQDIHFGVEEKFNKFFSRKNLSFYNIYPFTDKRNKLFFHFFFSTYKGLSITFFRIFPLIFRKFFHFFMAGAVTSTATKLSEYYLNFLNIYDGMWPEYKQKLPDVFHIGVKKVYNQQIDLQRSRVAFFQKWWFSLSHFRHVFSFEKTLIFFIQVCWYYMMPLLFHVSLFVYKIVWKRIHEFYLWRLRIKEIARIRFYELPSDPEYVLERKIKRHPWATRAYFKSLAEVPQTRPWICNFLEHQMRITPSPFLSEYWINLYKWVISLLFYRKLRKKSFIFKREFTYMFEKRNTSFIVNVLFNFKFWSFFFTFFYLFVARSFALLIVFVFFALIKVLLDISFFFYKLVLNKCLKTIYWVSLVVGYTIAYGFFHVIVLFFQLICLIFAFLYVTFKWLNILVFFFLYKLKFLKIFAPLFKVVRYIFIFYHDLILNIRFNCYWTFLHLLSMWSFVRFAFIISSGFLVFLIVTLWYGFKGVLLNRTVRQDYSKTISFFFRQETSIFYHDFQDFLFFISFFFKFVCLIFSFFIFLFGQVGWKLVKFIFDEGVYDDDSLKIRSEFPTRKVFQFLDIYVVLVFNMLKEFCLNFTNFIFFVIYSVILDFFMLLFRVFGVIIFMVCFFKNFIWHVLQRSKTGSSFLNKFKQLAQVIWFILKYILFLIQCLKKEYKKTLFYNFRFKELWSQSQINFLPAHKLIVIKVFNLFLSRRFLFFVLVRLKEVFKSSPLWVDFCKKTLKHLNDPDFNIERDLQELVVFVSVIYEFSAFYWAYIQKLSIEVGDLGWWLSYYNRKKISFQHALKQTTNFSKISKNSLKHLKKPSFNKPSRFFSKKHSYYLTLNNSFAGIKRYRAYIINSFYIEKAKVLFKEVSWFSHYRWVGNLLKRLGSFLGLSFLFEILFLRFQQPISSLLFGDKEKFFPLHVLSRLKYFKDFFIEFNWLVKFTYDSKSFGFDHFLLRIFSKFFPKWNLKDSYYTKYRSRWFSKIFVNLKPRVVDIFPKFRWNYFKIFIDCINFFFVSCCFSFFFILFLIVLCILVYFFVFFVLFYCSWLFFFWILNLLKRFKIIFSIIFFFFLFFILIL